MENILLDKLKTLETSNPSTLPQFHETIPLFFGKIPASSEVQTDPTQNENAYRFKSVAKQLIQISTKNRTDGSFERLKASLDQATEKRTVAGFSCTPESLADTIWAQAEMMTVPFEVKPKKKERGTMQGPRVHPHIYWADNIVFECDPEFLESVSEDFLLDNRQVKFWQYTGDGTEMTRFLQLAQKKPNCKLYIHPTEPFIPVRLDASTSLGLIEVVRVHVSHQLSESSQQNLVDFLAQLFKKSPRLTTFGLNASGTLTPTLNTMFTTLNVHKLEVIDIQNVILTEPSVISAHTNLKCLWIGYDSSTFKYMLEVCKDFKKTVGLSLPQKIVIRDNTRVDENFPCCYFGRFLEVLEAQKDYRLTLSLTGFTLCFQQKESLVKLISTGKLKALNFRRMEVESCFMREIQCCTAISVMVHH